MRSFILAAIDRVQGRGDVHEMLDRGIESPVALELPSPFDRRSPSPRIGRLAQRITRSAAEALRAKVEERAADVAHRRATVRAVERRLDHGVTSRRKIPRARESHGRAAIE